MIGMESGFVLRWQKVLELIRLRLEAIPMLGCMS